MTEGTLETAVDILSRLVAFDTVSDRSNLACIDFIAARLAAQGVEIWRAPNRDRDKAALLALIGPKVEGGIVLSGHTDVVPVADQPWSGDPFVLRHSGSRLVGRGTCDMKGYLACALAAVG